MSNKVKHGSVPSFHDSYLGFLCILGCFETKNVGRTTMMVRNTIVSTVDALDPVFHDAQHDALWTWLQLEPDSHIHPHYFVVVNEVCIPVTEACFQRIQLYALNNSFDMWNALQNLISCTYDIKLDYFLNFYLERTSG
ncbi:RNA_pol_Rpb2_6 domain-containing protein [Trichonephila clavata]|uniref:RNA_pol_Rpb2_6 domain-containing protein n=1 Tax=Trichonephila clavata TaxID=2740835 RepID=A0A8X6GZV2_TRICU|nr:RNA_pol_Rpb2_6 domain-containing protein [Trichonephila clavata]